MTSTLCDIASSFGPRGSLNEHVRTRYENCRTNGVTKTQAQAIVDSMLKSIMSAAANGEEISLPGFGKFKVKETPEREGRNPASGDKIKIAASRKLTYLPAKAIKELLNR
jgi:DNA-binding protein HU-beta